MTFSLVSMRASVTFDSRRRSRRASSTARLASCSHRRWATRTEPVQAQGRVVSARGYQVRARDIACTKSATEISGPLISGFHDFTH
eukprot:2601067-Prymnesium_polylepis.1